MFYEEMMIDGEWHYRTTPDGEWRKGRKSANTPAPISVERLRELLAVSSLRLPLCQFGAHVDGADGDTVADCYYNAAHEQDGRDVAELFAAAVNALPTLLHQLAERDAALEREQGVREDAQRQLRAAERARDGMREQLRIESALLLAWARESREGGWSTHQVDPMKRRAGEIDAFLAASGGRDE